MTKEDEGLKLEHVIIVVLGLFAIFIVIKFLSALTILVPLFLVLIYTTPKRGLTISGATAFLGIIAVSLIPDIGILQGTQDSISFAFKMVIGGIIMCVVSSWALKNPIKWGGWQKRIKDAIDSILKKIGFISEENKS